jgi:DNA mismatch endonuclease Vsr
VILENVPTIEHDAGEVLSHASNALEAAGYSIAEAILDLSVFGVPQRRKRHILLATLLDSPDLAEVLSEPPRCGDHEARTVQWAIGDLAKITRGTGLDVASVPNRLNRERIQWLIDHDRYDLPNNLRPRCHQGLHSYVSMYGRLRWNAPAQTITTGFGSMGQGRFVHPSLPRTITPHEAARLQTFPDFFDFDSLQPRRTWATVIGNAVPPLFAIHLTTPLVQALKLTDSAVVRMNGSRPQRATKAAPLRASTSRRGVPPASSELIRRRMSTTKRRDTGPELALRAELHRLGLRYAVDRPVDGTRRRADVVFVSARVAVYVDGCFWHGCPDHGTVPKQSREWWVAKIEANRRRDADTDARLRAAGWTVLRFWEHDDPTAAARKVLKAVRGPTGRDLDRTR